MGQLQGSQSIQNPSVGNTNLCHGGFLSCDISVFKLEPISNDTYKDYFRTAYNLDNNLA